MKYYRLEDDKGYGPINTDNQFYNDINQFSQEFIHSAPGFYSSIPEEIKLSKTKEELLSLHCCFASKENFRYFNFTGYNIIELELNSVIAPKNIKELNYYFHKKDIISQTIIGKT